ncbi:hypothetical protein BG006_011303 [Podila minutissima]|uniref:Zn(2)-C6 fungal-type domain-containing protein n=1 Tax=Podila minutissima TaxID=64525 RepID=A0A9P5SS99_9FUNG|nr:hypothetical protein BG006_011303 [Podila minutissima]
MFEPIPPSSLLKIYKGCSNCRTQKIKCNGQEPCARCHAFGLQCQYIVLPNQAAHRLASLAATATAATTTTTITSSSSSPALPSTSSSPSLSSTLNTTSVTTPTIATTSNRTDSSPSQSLLKSSTRSPPTSKTRAPKKEKKRRAPSTRNPSQYDEFEASDVASSRSSQDPSTLASAQSPGTPNLILRAIVDATDPIYSPSASFSANDEPSATVEEMSRLIGLYLRYLHPVQRLVDENGPDFWTRLQKPLETGIASVVYAMCTMGAVFETKAPTAGLPDDLTLAYFRRTCAALDQGPEDMTTVQALLIMVPFYAVSNQEDEGQKAYGRSHDVAEKIQLGDAAMRLSTQEKLSAKDVEIRNTWRSLVWLETIANLTLLRSGPIELSKDLAGACLVPRPEEVPTSKTSIADIFDYHLCNLMRLFQSISKIKLPMSPRDVHAVTSILDAFGTWHSLLPKSLRAHSSKSVSSSKLPFSPHAAILDLYYRLGQILLLNNLPQSTRSSPTGLGPRRESPLRTLATCANGITATIGDLLKSADLKNYCLSHGVRCLTEAATIQMANTKESDPSISTPAKVNLMKTLWCIRQINFGLPADKLSAILKSFDASKATAPEPDVESRDNRECPS